MNATSSENSRVAKAFGVVGSATLLSRILGFVRDAVIAWLLGAGLNADAFFVAFRIPNLLRRLFAEGSLSIAFIPVFTGYLTAQGKDEAFSLARSALRMLCLLLVIAAVAGVLLSPMIIRLMAPGFIISPAKFSLAVLLTRVMFPYIIFICLAALCMGVLNALGHFAAPALAPVLLNLTMIGSMFFISPHIREPAVGLAFGVLIGGLLQLSLQLPYLTRNGFLFWQKARLYHPGLKRIGQLMGPAVFGAAVYQINILIGTLLASLLPEGSVSYLYYADRVVQFPLGVFAIATATAVLPSLSRQAAEKNFAALSDTFSYAMRFVFFITAPAMVGLMVLRAPIVTLLFQRGAFDLQAARMTASALFFYGLGLWAFSAVRIVVATFYALQDTRTPVKMAFVSVCVNILLSIILMKPLAHGGLALATSLASMVNLCLLVWALTRKIDTMEYKGMIESACKTLLCSAIMGLGVWAVAGATLPAPSGAVSGLLPGLGASILAGLVLYGAASFWLKSRELHTLLSLFKRGGRLKNPD
ncbi:MAG: murein biosynthesis integral membrane protein MurJ [Desulfobacterales bacterium]|nr:murein biosynthesis integral membrane protein MurJ [Desulfobacterales bacterium]